MISPKSPFFWCWLSLLLALLVFFLPTVCGRSRDEKPTNQVSKDSAPKTPLAAVLPPAKWQQVEKSVDHGLAWIASQQGC